MSLLGLEIDVTDESGHLAMCILCLFGGCKSMVNSPGHREIVVEHVWPLLCWGRVFLKDRIGSPNTSLEWSTPIREIGEDLERIPVKDS